jgi:AraC-like DNA-binding protein
VGVESFPVFQSRVNGLHFEVLDQGYLSGDATWKYYDVESPFSRLYLVTAGAASIRDRDSGRIVDLLPGRAYLVPSGRRCDYLCELSFEKFYLHFKLEFFYGLDVFGGVDRILELELPVDRTLEIASFARGGESDGSVAATGLLLTLLGSFLAQCPDGDEAVPPEYFRLSAFMRRKLSVDLGPADLARELGLDEARFLREFRRKTGMTVKSFIDRGIERNAKERLLSTDLSVKEIAWALGFKDEFYFSRFFKRKAGVSPRDYRNSNRLG